MSSFEKLKEGQISSLTLFGSELEPSAGNLATDITLEGRELVPPGAVKMTLIVPKRGLKGALP